MFKVTLNLQTRKPKTVQKTDILITSRKQNVGEKGKKREDKNFCGSPYILSINDHTRNNFSFPEGS
jgi:hypothetical protein